MSSLSPVVREVPRGVALAAGRSLVLSAPLTEECTSSVVVNCNHHRFASKQLSPSGTLKSKQVDDTSSMLSRTDVMVDELLHDRLKYKHAVAIFISKKTCFECNGLSVSFTRIK